MAITPTVNAQGQQVSSNVDPYLQQQNIPGTTGGINNMIRALLAGNDAYKQQQAGQNNMAQAAGSPVPGAVGPTSVGGPNGPTPLSGMPPTNPAAMTGGLGSSPTMTPPTTAMSGTSPMPGAGSPIGMDPATMAMMQGSPSPTGGDPVTQALMSPIPGQ